MIGIEAGKSWKRVWRVLKKEKREDEVQASFGRVGVCGGERRRVRKSAASVDAKTDPRRGQQRAVIGGWARLQFRALQATRQQHIL
jgi:hypothetical protein